MTQTEQVAVGQELLPCPWCQCEMSVFHDPPLVCFDGRHKKGCYLEEGGDWFRPDELQEKLKAWNTRLASTRPISNEEVRDAIEWMESIVDDDQHAENYDEADEGRKVIAALEHLSAENDRLSALVAQHEETIRIGQNAAGVLASQVVAANAREAEAREIISGLLERQPAIIRRADKLRGLNWLKAGEAEQ